MRGPVKLAGVVCVVLGCSMSVVGVAEDAAPAQEGGTLLHGEEAAEIVDTKIKMMTANLDEITVMRDRVKNEERDIKKLNCINERLAAMRGFLKVGEDAVKNYTKATGQKEKDHYFRLVTIGSDRLNVLHNEALACAGDSQLAARDVSRHMVVDDDIRDFDSTAILSSEDVGLHGGDYEQGLTLPAQPVRLP